MHREEVGGDRRRLFEQRDRVVAIACGLCPLLVEAGRAEFVCGQERRARTDVSDLQQHQWPGRRAYLDVFFKIQPRVMWVVVPGKIETSLQRGKVVRVQRRGASSDKFGDL